MTSAEHHFGAHNLIQNKGIGDRRNDPLPRLLDQLLDRAGIGTTVDRAVSRPWASALFEGRRHVVSLCLNGADAAARKARFVDGIESAQWSLPGHFVADISIDEDHEQAGAFHLDLSALTIEDW